jgi:hypothetical protein
METLTDRSGDAVARTVDVELALVRDAIAMVAAGGSRRVVVAGLRFGDKIIAQAEVLAEASGVKVVPLWSSDESGADIAVERTVVG